MQARHQTFDLLKGLAVLFMIQVHILELFASPEIFQSTLGKILLFIGGPPCAPVFLFVFGYFISKSRKTFLQLIKRGALVLIVGLLLNIALNFNLFYSVFKGSIQASVFEYLFGIDILINAGFSLFILAVIKHLKIKNPVLLIALMLISAFLGLFLLKFTPESYIQKYFFAVVFGATSWSYFPVFPWISYTLAGYTFYQVSKALKFDLLNWFRTKAIIIGAFLLFLFFTFKFALVISSNLQQYYHHGFIFFVWVLVFMAFYGFFINESERLFGKTLLLKYIKWLGKNVTMVYIIQWVIIGNIATEIYRSVDSSFVLVGSFLIILLLTSLISYFILFLRKK
jgi:uncharacterized membrane protein